MPSRNCGTENVESESGRLSRGIPASHVPITYVEATLIQMTGLNVGKAIERRLNTTPMKSVTRRKVYVQRE